MPKKNSLTPPATPPPGSTPESGADAVRARLARLGINDDDVKAAVRWARGEAGAQDDRQMSSLK